MFVIKRDGRKEQVKFEKISKRISGKAKDLKCVDSVLVAQKVIQGVYDGVTSRELDRLAVETAYSLSTKHPEYDKLALRLAISALHKETPNTFSEAVEILYNGVDSFGNKRSFVSEQLYAIAKKHASVLNSSIDYNRDYLFDYFGFKTLERSYLLKNNIWKDGRHTGQQIIERPQHMWMRVAIEIHRNDIESVLSTYEMLSCMRATHATPTLFNAGTPKNQLSSCFLVSNKDDSVTGIYDTIKECALISQSAGGIGIHIHDVRAKGSPIYGTGGVSNGIVPMLRNYNETARYIDQGGGKRKGSIAVYLEPWHADIFDFLDLRKNNGKEELRCRDLNLAIWAPDLFFKRVEQDQEWSLMCPNKCPGLSDVSGEDFEGLYLRYEAEGRAERTVKAQELWTAILESQIETGQPYLAAKDAGNKKSNQQNLGTIKSSNLCIEIFQHSDPNHTSVCNLASISLPSCVEGKKHKRTFNFQKLYDITKALTENLNKVIDNEFYPVETAQRSNMRDRPMGIGIQGLADVFAMMRYPWGSSESRELNRKISETMLFAALDTSADLSKQSGPYDSYEGSPASKGILQPDMWGVVPSDQWDWNALRNKIKKHGLRNSLSIALMPTASTSQILGNTECFEPITSNIYKRSTLSGEFIQVNKYLVEDLIELNLWDDEMRQTIIASNGSIQMIPSISAELKELYRTVWEISQKVIIDLAADRGPFICQSQSMNLYVKDPNFGKMTSAFFYAWKKGLKTLVYYTRTNAPKEASKVTVDRDIESQVIRTEGLRTEGRTKEENLEALVCSLENPENCEACSG